MAAFENLNLGTSPNDGTGTTLRAGGQIINDNLNNLAANITEENVFIQNQTIKKALIAQFLLENTTTAISSVGEIMGQFVVKTNDGSGGGDGIAGAIVVEAQGSSGATFDMVFKTKDFANEIERMRLLYDGGLKLSSLKSGTSQGTAGASADELWIDTADNSIKIGV